MSPIDILVDDAKRNEKYFKNYRLYAKKIKQTLSQMLHDNELRLLVFGSVVREEHVPSMSDIDILVISDTISLKASWQSKIRVDILKELGDIFAPFEIHFATRNLYDNWYHKFIKSEYVEIL